MGVSLVAYLAWTFSVVVPSVTLAMRTYGAYWLLPQPHAATESAGPWLAMWRHYWAMCGVSLCLLVRGTLSAFEVYRRSYGVGVVTDSEERTSFRSTPYPVGNLAPGNEAPP